MLRRLIISELALSACGISLREKTKLKKKIKDPVMTNIPTEWPTQTTSTFAHTLDQQSMEDDT
ncbi:hypothetical protein E2562_038011 [Oryza meyeriana var. granulata]|uniref:Uncharacterized protein n=1 Tax=Oryza meyeriana var. granulata TaxID=110450 RepID=A0A6G1F228_9ORYZ|nr:hypothetical protein E2562_038011 [Oryza meyeriana var. granulata]